MTVKDLIKELEVIAKQHGNLEVFVKDPHTNNPNTITELHISRDCVEECTIASNVRSYSGLLIDVF